MIDKRDISPGISNWGWTEVIEGVRAGESVVSSIDIEGLRDGALATISNGSE